MGPSGRLIDEKQPDEATRQALRREMTEAFAAHVSGGELRLPSAIFLVSAGRPG
jgi:hypothetical protein